MRGGALSATVVPSPVGELTLVAQDGALCALHMDSAKHAPDPTALGERDDAGFTDATAQLGEYFARERTTFDLPLAPVGNAFEQKVWALLRDIPYGETRSYGDLARALGDVGFSQAVGAANGRNPIGIIVPCHRVIAADGTLGGYGGDGWGGHEERLAIKRDLLLREGVTVRPSRG